MPESTLALKKADFASEVGVFLGFGGGVDAGDATWTTRQSRTLDGFVKAGLHQFYFPPVLDGEREAHTWSFLHPSATVTLAADASTAALPDDFGGLEGSVTLSESNRLPRPLVVTGDGVIDQKYAVLPVATGTPLWCAVRPLKGTTIGRGQRFELYVWPLADQAYTLRLSYQLLPNYLDGSHPYAYGGAAHSQTILESCLAKAEQRLDDAIGVHSQLFLQHLAASVSLDRRLVPQRLGYNGDDTEHRYVGRRDLLHGWSGITFDGVST